jgi:hypothetical protein
MQPAPMPEISNPPQDVKANPNPDGANSELPDNVTQFPGIPVGR